MTANVAGPGLVPAGRYIDNPVMLGNNIRRSETGRHVQFFIHSLGLLFIAHMHSVINIPVTLYCSTVFLHKCPGHNQIQANNALTCHISINIGYINIKTSQTNPFSFQNISMSLHILHSNPYSYKCVLYVDTPTILP